MAERSTGNYFELIYADIATFGKAPLVDPTDLGDYDVGLYGVPWDATSSLRSGARLGPRRIREQSIWFHEVWNPQSTPLIGYGPPRKRKVDRIRMADCGDITVAPGNTGQTAQSIRATSRAIALKSFPIMLGGDHYVMFPAYQGVCDARPDERIGIVQIDAHNDLIDDDAVFGKHWSGTPMRRALDHSGVSPAALAQIGLRGFIGEAERAFQLTHGIRVIPMPEFRNEGPGRAAELAMEAVLKHCDVVYVTIDIDGMDPSCAPGTCTPVPGGIYSDELLELVRTLGSYEEVVALDLVEVAPPLDPTDQTPLLAAHALFAFIEERFLLQPATAEDNR